MQLCDKCSQSGLAIDSRCAVGSCCSSCTSHSVTCEIQCSCFPWQAMEVAAIFLYQQLMRSDISVHQNGRLDIADSSSAVRIASFAAGEFGKWSPPLVPSSLHGCTVGGDPAMSFLLSHLTDCDQPVFFSPHRRLLTLMEARGENKKNIGLSVSCKWSLFDTVGAIQLF